MNVIEKIIRADRHRKTRFHDMKGHLVDAGGLFYAPQALVETVVRLTTGHLPVKPWISYRFTQCLERTISKKWNVIEFGSGMSTVWFALHCSFVHSVELDSAWYERVNAMIKSKAITNVRYLLRSLENYDDVSGYPNHWFDFALVDGAMRDRCVRAVVDKVKHGGFVYLDNTDSKMATPDSEMRTAERELLEAVRRRGGQIRRYTDFAPAQFHCNEGTLARLD